MAPGLAGAEVDFRISCHNRLFGNRRVSVLQQVGKDADRAAGLF